MKKNILWTITLLVFLFTDFTFAQNIVINEILASNNSSVKDEDGSRQDWIELYNNGSTSVDLSGYGLSDDPLLPFKWKFPAINLDKGQYLIVWASDKNRSVANSPLHTNFKISSKGNTILLTNPSGTIVDQIPPVYLQVDMSYGRFPNGSGPFVYFVQSTPNAVNSTPGLSEAVSPPVFSSSGKTMGSGFYQDGFDLTLSTTNTGATILYTLDGSEPDEKNLSGTTYKYKNQYPEQAGQAFGPFLENTFKTLTYSGPISIADRTSQPNKVSDISSTWDFDPAYLPDGPIFKGTVVKAKAIKPGAISSETVTKNYFISPKGASRFTIPVLSISTNENLLFDYDNGIYVAGVDFDTWRKGGATGTPTYHQANFGRKPEPEIVGNISYFVGGKEQINQKIGIKIHGASSRIYPTKSLDLFARSDYGDDKMSYKFFSDQPYTSYERLTVKNGGSSDYFFMFRDEITADLVKDLPMETEAYQPIITFINGEYWGIFRLRERYDNNYFKLVYNIPSDQLDLLEDQGRAKAGDAKDYNNLYDYIEGHSLAGSTEFNTVKNWMDTDNYRDYYITNIFYSNRDWPGTNIVYWRKRTNYQPNAPYGHDGRWRWAIHDMDGTFFDPSYNELAAGTDPNGPPNPNPAWSTLIIRKLLENDGFKIDFINRFADLMNTNFLSSRITSRIDSMKAQIAPEMEDQYFRWKGPTGPSDYNYFLKIAYDFAKQRPDYQRTHIRQKFGISKNINVTLNVSGAEQGYIKINTINIIDGTPGISGNPYPWTGIYFHNIPLKLKAIAKPGFAFDHWMGASSSTQAEITITPTADFSITAVFVPSNVSFSYPSPNVFTVGTAITNLTPTVSKTIDSYSISPALSAGLNFNSSTGVISGTPTAVSPLTTYTVTANYEGGNLTSTLAITVSDIPPTKVTYNSPNVFIVNTAITSLKPTIEGGPVTSYSIAPVLPAGLSFNTNTGEISGTPTVVSPNKTYTVTANYEGGSLTSTLEITVNGIPPTKVTYNTPNVFNINTAITSLKPTIEGGPVTSYSIAPVLPAGLSINTNTGEISGTPTVVSSNKTYTVTANYSGGSLTSALEIKVNDVGINSLIYDSPNVFTINVPIANLSPTVTGGKVISYSIAPSLPAGLSFNTTTGTISGTPTAISPTTKYTVTAENSNGSLTVEILITVNDLAPNNLIYPSPNVFPRNVAITDLNPSISGGPVISYNVVPNLPTGLLLNPITGTISGLPTEVSELKTYIVTALNSGGSASFDLLIAVQENLSVHDNLLSNKISVYPNPFSNSVNIAGIDAAFSYKVFTIEGKLISNATNSKNSIELSALPVGMYILQLSFDDRTVVKKIFKNK